MYRLVLADALVGMIQERNADRRYLNFYFFCLQNFDYIWAVDVSPLPLIHHCPGVYFYWARVNLGDIVV